MLIHKLIESIYNYLDIPMLRTCSIPISKNSQRHNIVQAFSSRQLAAPGTDIQSEEGTTEKILHILLE